ncbi:MAG TPA: hypothetical protein VL947_09530 [Cytophagales bacterium]|nr:hypothetical protein [Cytophagales bacterium]
MKIIGWIFVAMAAAFLAFILYFAIGFLLNSTLGTEAKVLACFLALLALGTTIGRLVMVFRDLKGK